MPSDINLQINFPKKNISFQNPPLFYVPSHGPGRKHQPGMCLPALFQAPLQPLQVHRAHRVCVAQAA